MPQQVTTQFGLPSAVSTLQIVTLDFETYYSQTYSLRNKEFNMSEYIRHPEFLVHCVAIKLDDKPVIWCKGGDIKAALDSIDWSKSALLCHNTAFDGLILSHHFGHVPAYYMDTLSMARAVHSSTIENGLNEVAEFYGLGNKLPVALDATKGLRELPDAVMQHLGVYCCVDVTLCHGVFQKLLQKMPVDEMELIHITLTAFCNPVLEVDIPLVTKYAEEEAAIQEEVIAVSGLTRKQLSSSPQFAAALQAIGQDVPMKISPTTGKETPAFAKNDMGFIALGESPNPQVRRLYKARLAAKSTLGGTRSARLIKAGANGNHLPVMYNYYGAATGRWSGGNKLNLQNLPRGSDLRRAIRAPKGHMLVVVDSAQIECRVNAWIAGHEQLLNCFRNKEDPYLLMASAIYGIPFASMDKKTHESERFVGKVAVLGLGYQMGADKFKHTLESGAMGPPVVLAEHLYRHVVNTYRTQNKPIADFWQYCEHLLLYMLTGTAQEYKCLHIPKGEARIVLPNGLALQYPNLEADYDNHRERYTNYRYFSHKEKLRDSQGKPALAKYIYGGLLCENIVQALARIVVAEQMLACQRELFTESDKIRRIVMTTHDEAVACVPENEAEDIYTAMQSIMSRPPIWAPDLPVSSDGGFAYEYSK